MAVVVVVDVVGGYSVVIGSSSILELQIGVVDGSCRRSCRISSKGRVSCFGPPVRSLSCRQLTVLWFWPVAASGQRSLPVDTFFWIPSVFFMPYKIHAWLSTAPLTPLISAWSLLLVPTTLRVSPASWRNTVSFWTASHAAAGARQSNLGRATKQISFKLQLLST